MLGSYGLDIARKAERDYYHIHKFGSNPDIDSGAVESVWSAGGLYPWNALETAQTLYCLSTSSSDTAILEIQGLDADFNPQTESLNLTGTTAVTTENTFIRVFRMKYINGGNAGTVTARTVSDSGTVVAQIDAGVSQTLMSVYTIPANTRGYLIQYIACTGKNRDAEVLLYTKEPAQNNFQLKSEMHTFQNSIIVPFGVPLVLPPKTDIDFRASSENNNTKVIVSFDIVLDPS
jgi:hypothetical protein